MVFDPELATRAYIDGLGAGAWPSSAGRNNSKANRYNRASAALALYAIEIFDIRHAGHQTA